ncbi:hypothetical protein GTO27_12330 [Candidatus Bathyarchaeota archaeon]|nr:hypothetical protein [Candidatus Bathyarchaeota archaeon]
MEPIRSVGICGQAPSDLGRDFIKFLVIHLDSIGVNPDKVVETLLTVKEIEDDLRNLIEKCYKDPAKISKELTISEVNANYLIKKLSKISELKNEENSQDRGQGKEMIFDEESMN